MSANDPDDFVKTEINWLDIPLKENKPYLGICLGAQMLVHHLGGKVENGAVTAASKSAGIPSARPNTAAC